MIFKLFSIRLIICVFPHGLICGTRKYRCELSVTTIQGLPAPFGQMHEPLASDCGRSGVRVAAPKAETGVHGGGQEIDGGAESDDRGKETIVT